MAWLREPNGSEFYFTYLSEFQDTWTGQTEVEMFAFSLVTLGAAIGNIMILNATWRLKRPLAAMNLFLCSQCASDLLLTSFNPIIMVVRHTQDWVLGDVICPLLNYAQSASAVTSILCMTSLAVDRYLQMAGRRRAANSLQRHSAKVVAATWVVPLVWLSPFLVAWKVLHVRREDGGQQYTFCSLEWPAAIDRVSFILLTGTTIFVAPLLLIAFCYTRVLLNVRQSTRRVVAAPAAVGGATPQQPPPLGVSTSSNGNNTNAKANANINFKTNTNANTTTNTSLNTNSTTNTSLNTNTKGDTSLFSRRRAATERKLLTMLVLSVLLFGALWLPFYCFSILIFYVDAVTSSQYCWVLLLGFTSACVNPVLIIGFNSHYRRHVAAQLGRCSRKLERCLVGKAADRASDRSAEAIETTAAAVATVVNNANSSD